MYEWFDDLKHLYLVFEYCSGGEIYQEIIRNGPMDERRAANFLYQILLALNYLHKQGICHRDIKPDNCLVLVEGSNPSVKVIDFGLSIEFVDPSIVCFHK